MGLAIYLNIILLIFQIWLLATVIFILAFSTQFRKLTPPQPDTPCAHTYNKSTHTKLNAK